jgi:hypothetical protein
VVTSYEEPDVTMLAIQGLGAITPIGGDAAATVAGIYVDMQVASELPIKGSGGASTIAAAIPLSSAGCDRLFDLASFAFQEATASLPDGADLGLVLCGPASDDEAGLTGGFPAFAARMQRDTSLNILPAASRVFSSGRSAVLDGLAFVQSALKARTAPAICLLGVDSLVTGRRLRRLRTRGELSRRGFTPGEAAGAILLVQNPDAASLAVISGIGSAEEPSFAHGRAVPNLGKGFSSAVANAAADAGLSAVPFACLVHDLSAMPADCEELVWAKSCPTLSVPSQMSVLAPSSSVGFTGAAMGMLSLLTLAFLIDKGAVAGPGLCLLSTNDARRGAAVMIPSPRRREAERRGHG